MSFSNDMLIHPLFIFQETISFCSDSCQVGGSLIEKQVPFPSSLAT